MKFFMRFLGIIVLLVITGFAFTACGNDDCTSHTWGAWENITTQPNCTTTGTGIQKCTKCDVTNPNTTIPTNNVHNFADNWVETTAAGWHNNTIDECGNGEETLTCTRCPETDTQPIPCKGTEGLIIEDNVVGDNESLDVAHVCIPDSATEISNYAFYENTNITSIRIGVNVTIIDQNAFFYCENLETVIFAEGSLLETIENYSFEGCASLTSITIPANIFHIGDSAFGNCTNLETVIVLATEPPFLVLSVGGGFGGGGVSLPTTFSHTHDNLKIFVPADSLQDYKNDWSEYADIIEAI